MGQWFWKDNDGSTCISAIGILCKSNRYSTLLCSTIFSKTMCCKSLTLDKKSLTHVLAKELPFHGKVPPKRFSTRFCNDAGWVSQTLQIMPAEHPQAVNFRSIMFNLAIRRCDTHTNTASHVDFLKSLGLFMAILHVVPPTEEPSSTVARFTWHVTSPVAVHPRHVTLCEVGATPGVGTLERPVRTGDGPRGPSRRVTC